MKRLLLLPFILVFCCLILITLVPFTVAITAVAGPLCLITAAWREESMEEINEVLEVFVEICKFPFLCVKDILSHG